MLPILGPITPYRRLCGAVFVVISLVLAPNLYFAVSLAVSPVTARWSIWASLLLYLAIVAVPALRRVTRQASIVALVVAFALVALVNAFAKPVKQVTAAAIGFYDDRIPWLDAQPARSSWTYRDPFAGYTLEIPSEWQRNAGPVAGTTELILRRDQSSGVAARLRPSCDLSDEPLATAVFELLGEQSVLRNCGYAHGLEACLLARGGALASPTTPVRWEWLGRRPGTDAQIRLTFELFDDDARSDALSIISSATAAPASYKASACPNPSSWAEPF